MGTKATNKEKVGDVIISIRELDGVPIPFSLCRKLFAICTELEEFQKNMPDEEH